MLGALGMHAGMLGRSAMKNWAKPAGLLAAGGLLMGGMNSERSAMSGAMTSVGTAAGWGLAGALGGAAWGAGSAMYRGAKAFGGFKSFMSQPAASSLLMRRGAQGMAKFGKWGMMGGAALGLGKALIGSNQPIMPV